MAGTANKPIIVRSGLHGHILVFPFSFGHKCKHLIQSQVYLRIVAFTGYLGHKIKKREKTVNKTVELALRSDFAIANNMLLRGV